MEQKEFKCLLSAIHKWVEANHNDVAFVGSFVSYDREKKKKGLEDCIKDDIILAYGGKGEVKLLLGELEKNFKKEKGNFINW